MAMGDDEASSLVRGGSVHREERCPRSLVGVVLVAAAIILVVGGRGGESEDVEALREQVRQLAAASSLFPAAELREIGDGASLLALDPVAVAESLGPDAAVEVLADSSGGVAPLRWLEGPAWLPASRSVLFTDTIANQMLRWDEPTDRLAVQREPSGAPRRCIDPTQSADPDCLQVLEPGANGLLVAEEQLLFCNHGRREISALPLANLSDAAPQTIVSHFQGRRLNSPNDLALSPTTGDLFFTDPPYGLRLGTASCAETHCPPRGCSCGLPFSSTPPRFFEQLGADGGIVAGVYRLPAPARQRRTQVEREAGLERLTDTLLEFPNGIAVSPDGSSLYVAGSGPRSRIVSFPLGADGGLSGAATVLTTNAALIRTNMAVAGRLQSGRTDETTAAAVWDSDAWTLGVFDGMTVDSSGRIWATAAGGVVLLEPDGRGHLATLQLGSRAGNCVLGEGGQLYVAADHRLLRINTRARRIP